VRQDAVVVNTPESVSLTLELAGLGSRFVAVAIDTMIQAVLFLGLSLAASAAGWVDATEMLLFGSNRQWTWGLALVTLAVWLIFYCYYLIFELLWDGQTPGKRAVGLRVLDRSGRPAGAVALVVRNLVRLVDSLPMPVAYPAGVVSFLSTPLGQRLGDLAAGTIVVRERRLRLARPGQVPGGPSRTPGMPPDLTLLRIHVGALRTEELDLTRQFLERRNQLTWQAREVLGWRLCSVLAHRMQYRYPILNREAFLEAVVMLQPAAVIQ